MLGESVGNYRIQELIGAGGMGVVYRAADSRLGRQVALKFLPEESSKDQSALARFLREARAASALNHPSICTVYDIGEHAGRPYIVMELLEGQSLRDRISQGPLDLELILELCIQIANALEAAHSKGIVHRDIKPDNVFITGGGRAKILDFGLAKATLPELDPAMPNAQTLEEPITRTGTMMGSIPYMSPEQALGQDLDGRTDIFSLGAVLFEMGTGRRAFPGATAAAVFDAILNTQPEWSGASGLPDAFRQVVGKALEKDRDLRYQSAAELCTDLKRLLRDRAPSAERAGRQPSVKKDARRAIAVLPFRLLSGEAEYEFLVLALAEAVSHDLSQNRELALRSTGAVARYTQGDADPMQVARELRADVVVEGSIQKQGRTVRVQVHAWEAPGRSTLLSVKLDGSLDDLFGLQDRVAAALSKELGVQTPAATADFPTPNAGAYELFLRASERLIRWNHVDTLRAIEMLRSAVTLDPAFGQGWSRLASALVSMGALFEPAPRWFEEATGAIDKALALVPDNSEAWTARGRMLWSQHLEFRNAEALRDLCRACAHPAHPPDAFLWRAVIMGHVGLHDEAISMARDMLGEEPHNPMVTLVLGETLAWHGDPGGGLEYVRRSVRQDPSLPYGHLFLPSTLLYLDRLEEAERAIEAGRGILGEDSMLLAHEGLLWAKRGEQERAAAALERVAQSRLSVSHIHHTYHYAAAAHAVLGDGERAVKYLTQASRLGLPNYPAYRIDRHFDGIRDREDFTQLMRQLEVGWDALRAEFGGLAFDPHSAGATSGPEAP